MNTKNIVLIGVSALAGYYLYVWYQNKYRNKLGVPESNKGVGEMPKNKESKADNKVDLSVIKNEPSSSVRNPVTIEDIVVPKPSVMIPPINLIPNVYDRGVGREMAVSADGSISGFYNNLSPQTLENIQMACRCADKHKINYKFDLPTLK